MDYSITEDSEKMDIDEVARLLGMTYWAKERTKEQIGKSMENSSCYGIYLNDEQKLVGFARVVSDYATMYYLSDVVIDEDYRHKGLGTALVSYVVSRPEFAGLHGMLITRDAHGLYRQVGFEELSGRFMFRSSK